jgi:hypothetical protein
LASSLRPTQISRSLRGAVAARHELRGQLAPRAWSLRFRGARRRGGGAYFFSEPRDVGARRERVERGAVATAPRARPRARRTASRAAATAPAARRPGQRAHALAVAREDPLEVLAGRELRVELDAHVGAAVPVAHHHLAVAALHAALRALEQLALALERDRGLGAASSRATFSSLRSSDFSSLRSAPATRRRSSPALPSRSRSR